MAKTKVDNPYVFNLNKDITFSSNNKEKIIYEADYAVNVGSKNNIGVGYDNIEQIGSVELKTLLDSDNVFYNKRIDACYSNLPQRVNNLRFENMQVIPNAEKIALIRDDLHIAAILDQTSYGAYVETFTSSDRKDDKQLAIFNDDGIFKDIGKDITIRLAVEHNGMINGIKTKPYVINTFTENAPAGKADYNFQVMIPDKVHVVKLTFRSPIGVTTPPPAWKITIKNKKNGTIWCNNEIISPRIMLPRIPKDIFIEVTPNTNYSLIVSITNSSDVSANIASIISFDIMHSFDIEYNRSFENIYDSNGINPDGWAIAEHNTSNNQIKLYNLDDLYDVYAIRSSENNDNSPHYWYIQNKELNIKFKNLIDTIYFYDNSVLAPEPGMEGIITDNDNVFSLTYSRSLAGMNFVKIIKHGLPLHKYIKIMTE